MGKFLKYFDSFILISKEMEQILGEGNVKVGLDLMHSYTVVH